jgi:hypothetical protein
MELLFRPVKRCFHEYSGCTFVHHSKSGGQMSQLGHNPKEVPRARMSAFASSGHTACAGLAALCQSTKSLRDIGAVRLGLARRHAFGVEAQISVRLRVSAAGRQLRAAYGVTQSAV